MTYAIGATSFAALCSIVWLLMGGSAVSAVGMYLVSGQVAMAALIARSALGQRVTDREK